MLTKTWDSRVMYFSIPVERRSIQQGMGVRCLLSSQEISTCDQHAYLTMKSHRHQPKSSGLKLLCRVHSFTESVKRSANWQEKRLKTTPLKWKTRHQVNTNGMTGGKEIRFWNLLAFLKDFFTLGGEEKVLGSLRHFFITFFSNFFCFSFQLEKKTEVPPNCHPAHLQFLHTKAKQFSSF